MALEDSLIKLLAEAKAPHAYSHEVRSMAQEIMDRRAAERAACGTNQQVTSAGTSTANTPGLPFSGKVYP